MELTKQCILAIERTDYGPLHEIIIVDNASTDGTVDWIKNKMPKNIKGKLVENKYNMSFSTANNKAAELSKTKFLCFLNNDIIPTQHWLSHLLRVISLHDNAAITCPMLITPGRETIQHAGVVFQDNGLPYHRFFGKSPQYKDANVVEKVPAATGACLLIRKEVFDSVGGFDETYFYGFEDIDLCNKVRQKGHEIYYVPQSRLYHYESRTPGRYDNDDANMQYYFNKWVIKKT